MGTVASMIIVVGDPEQAEKCIAAKVTVEELQMMQRFDLNDGDGEISRAEFILLSAVRLGALDPQLIDKINERFVQLDRCDKGMLSYEDLLEVQLPPSAKQELHHIIKITPRLSDTNLSKITKNSSFRSNTSITGRSRPGSVDGGSVKCDENSSQVEEKDSNIIQVVDSSSRRGSVEIDV